jgi:uncharacterized membrane protein
VRVLVANRQHDRRSLMTAEKLPWVIRLRASSRLWFALGAALFAYLLTPEPFAYQTRALITWNAGAMMYLALAWSTIILADSGTTRMRARMQDSSRYIIFVLVVTAATVSVVAIGFLLGNVKELAFWPRTIRLALFAFALISSWLLIQTLFAFHYARRFYMSQKDPHFEPRGLQFPGGSDPDFLDFTYFAFVVGMTSQVSDVAVTGQHMRRVTLMHGVLSFVFNIAILAMSINIIAGVI